MKLTRDEIAYLRLIKGYDSKKIMETNKIIKKNEKKNDQQKKIDMQNLMFRKKFLEEINKSFIF